MPVGKGRVGAGVAQASFVGALCEGLESRSKNKQKISKGSEIFSSYDS